MCKNKIIWTIIWAIQFSGKYGIMIEPVECNIKWMGGWSSIYFHLRWKLSWFSCLIEGSLCCERVVKFTRWISYSIWCSPGTENGHTWEKFNRMVSTQTEPYSISWALDVSINRKHRRRKEMPSSFWTNFANRKGQIKLKVCFCIQEQSCVSKFLTFNQTFLKLGAANYQTFQKFKIQTLLENKMWLLDQLKMRKMH